MNRKGTVMQSGNLYLRLASCLMLLCIINACVSKDPATRFYSFFPAQDIQAKSQFAGALGVGPVVLPEYLENPAVVSLTDGQQLRVSGNHAWAGSLQDAITRVAADDLAQSFSAARVIAFPWDNRVRPDFQLRLRFSEFAGRRGGEVRAAMSWTLLDKRGANIIAQGSVKRELLVRTDGVEAYVQALNQLLNQAMETTAVDIAKHLEP